jgi:predicted metal-dependent hydrolase
MRTAEPLAVYLARVPWVSADGRQWALECAETAVRPFFVFMEGDEPVILRHRGGAAAEGDLLALLRGVAGVALPRRVAVLGARVSVPFKRVCVRDQQGRWGSCSGTGSVSLNWRLVLLPPELQDYVILHELAHRREMNHSARFWKLLSGWDATCEANDRALSKQWGHLMDLGRGGASLE